MHSMANTHPVFLAFRTRIALEREGALIVTPVTRAVWLGGLPVADGGEDRAERAKDQQDRLFQVFNARLPVLEAGLSCNARPATLSMKKLPPPHSLHLFCLRIQPLFGTGFSGTDLVKMTDGILKPLAVASGLPHVVLDPGFQPRAQHALGDWMDRPIDARLIGELVKDQALVEDLWLKKHLQVDLPVGPAPVRGMRL